MALLLYKFLFILFFMTASMEFISNHETDNLSIDIGISDLSGHKIFQTIDFFGKTKKSKLDWWQTSVIYEIYPRSFKDTNGNGVGDIRGIIEKIPYLKDIGIDTIWLTPIFTSPGTDLGYDISDYKNVDELMGTMDDLDELIFKLHENGMKILLDFVPNHTSNEHKWFVKSVQKIEPYTDYYVWADAKYVNGTRQEPNNWMSNFKGSMWEWNEHRQQYYLHQFNKHQPDLNFWNPLVSAEIKNILRFWLDKGVDGFRFDAVSCLYERRDLKDTPPNPNNEVDKIYGYTQCLDETFEEVKEWRAVIDEYKTKDGITRLMVMESYMPMKYEKKLYGNSTHLGAHFPLSLTLLGISTYDTAKDYVKILTKFLQELSPNAWTSWSMANHDIGHSTMHFCTELIDGILMMQMLLPRGTPVVYSGDELAMTAHDLREDQLVDIASKLGYSPREKHRTPFQWDSSAQAGFSNKTVTWLPVNPNYVKVNVEYQTNAIRSHLKIFKELVKLRQLEVFRSGDLNFYEVSKYVFAFSRSNNIFKSYFVVLNLGSEMEHVNLRKVKQFLPRKMTVLVASLLAEQTYGTIYMNALFYYCYNSNEICI